jgi:hypothetical protein
MLAIIINFNLLDWPRAMVEWMSKEPRLNIVILDNASSYPPLLEWYEKCPAEVIRLKENIGSESPWKTGLVNQRYGKSPYIVSDPDLDLSGIPADWLRVLERGLSYRGITKCGFSLAVDDLPEVPQRKWVKDNQNVHWKPHPVAIDYYDAAVDTTFALYIPNGPFRPGFHQLRTKPPYTARHLPWYVRPGEAPADLQWYAKHWMGRSSTMCRHFNWVFREKKHGHQ